MSDISAKTLELYEKLVATQPSITRKGKANPYTSLNGRMFSFINKDGRLALRLPEAEREAFLKKYKTKIAVSYGAVMKEYVVVPPALLARTRELARHFAVSVEYMSGMKPKPTTRKKA